MTVHMSVCNAVSAPKLRLHIELLHTRGFHYKLSDNSEFRPYWTSINPILILYYRA
jgi:hypothetical protein